MKPETIKTLFGTIVILRESAEEIRYDNWFHGLRPEEMKKFSGIANCGCVAHAEEGIPCIHDYQKAISLELFSNKG